MAMDVATGVLFGCGSTFGYWNMTLDTVYPTHAGDVIVFALNVTDQELLWIQQFSSTDVAEGIDVGRTLVFDDTTERLYVSGTTTGKGFNTNDTEAEIDRDLVRKQGRNERREERKKQGTRGKLSITLLDCTKPCPFLKSIQTVLYLLSSPAVQL